MCSDSEPDNLLGNTMQWDASLAADDRFQWTFDPYLDGRSGYHFEVNPSGAMGDGLLSATDNIQQQGNVGAGASGGDARAWDGIWFSRVKRTEMGWSIEVE